MFLRKPGCSPDERDEKLKSDSRDVGGVKVVRIMYLLAFGEGKRARKVEEITYWWDGRDKLPSTWQRSWMIAKHTDGSLRPSCVKCRCCLARPCLNAWKAVSLSIDACAKEVSKPHACGKMATQILANVEEEWMKQRRGALMVLKQGDEECINLQFYVGRQLLDHIPFQETSGADVERSIEEAVRCGQAHTLLKCEDNTSKDPFSRCEIGKTLGYRLS